MNKLMYSKSKQKSILGASDVFRKIWSLGALASHADVLRGSSRVPALGTRDEPLRTSAWEAMGAPEHCY